MNRRRLLTVCAAMCLCATLALAQSDRPRIVELIPGDGHRDVRTNWGELRVTFDRDMDTSGASWIGGGETFPDVTGPPQWIDARTCVLPVRLQPNHRYTVGINNLRYQSFRSAQGVPVEPYTFTFTTGDGAVSVPEGQYPRSRPVRELREAVDRQYSYRDLRGIDWYELFARYEQDFAQPGATTDVRFAAIAARLLGEAQDIHIIVDAHGWVMPTYRRSVQANFAWPVVAQLVPGMHEVSDCVYVGQFDDGIGYILIDSWRQDRQQAIRAAVEAIAEFQRLGAAGLIIDVRRNNGGSEYLAREVAGCFVRAPVVYAMHEIRDANAPGGFGPRRQRVLEPNGDGVQYAAPVAVLMGPANMSSGEAFLLMMRAAGARLFGERSYGASGNPQPIELCNGVTIHLPSWRALRADGTCFEGEGIAPDERLAYDPRVVEEFGDPVLDAALRWLRTMREQ